MGSKKRLPCTAWLSLLLLALASGNAFAAPPGQTGRAASPGASNSDLRSIRISYHDLDLATPQGIANLYIRIRRAAAEVCDAERPPTGTRVERPAAAACVRSAIVATVKQLGVPGLAALDTEQEAIAAFESTTKPQCEVPARSRIII